MAAIIVEIVIDVGSEMIADAEFAEFAEALESAQQVIQEQTERALTEAINEQLTEAEANTEAIDAGYSRVAQINEDLADEWRFKVEEKAQQRNVQLDDTNPGTGQSYDEVSPDSSPDKADIDEDSPQEEDANCVKDSEGEACQDAKAKNTEKYLNWAKRVFGVFAFAAAVTGAYLLGGLLRTVCRLFSCGDCKQGCSGDCKSSGCNCEKKCDTNVCIATKNLIQNLRKYFWIILVSGLIISLILVVLSKSVTVLIICTIINVLIVFLRGQFGNFLATAVCNEAASACFFSTGKVKC